MTDTTGDTTSRDTDTTHCVTVTEDAQVLGITYDIDTTRRAMRHDADTTPLLEHMRAEIDYLRAELAKRSNELAEERRQSDIIQQTALARIPATAPDASSDAPQASGHDETGAAAPWVMTLPAITGAHNGRGYTRNGHPFPDGRFALPCVVVKAGPSLNLLICRCAPARGAARCFPR